VIAFSPQLVVKHFANNVLVQGHLLVQLRIVQTIRVPENFIFFELAWSFPKMVVRRKKQ